MSEIKWKQLDYLSGWHEARIDIVANEVVLEAHPRRGGDFVARVVLEDDYELAEREYLPTLDAAKARAVEMLREIGTAMVRAAGGAG